MRILAVILISFCAFLSSCKEPPSSGHLDDQKNPVAQDVQDELKKFDTQLKEYQEKVAVLGGALDPKNETYARDLITFAQNLKSMLSKAETDVITKRKANGITEKPTEFKKIRDEITFGEEKAISVLSRIMEPKLAQIAKYNDALLDNQLKLTQNIKVNEKVTGLENCGNTCFMNSIFQSLFHTRELNQLLQVPLKDLPFAVDIMADDSFLKILHETFANYIKPEEKEISTEKLSQARATYFPSFKANRQGDAQEYLNSLFTRLGQELNVARKINLIVSDEYKGQLKFIENYAKAGGTEYSLMDRWFKGYFKSVKKKDSQTSSTYDPFNILTLNFPDDMKKPLTLDYMYEYFSKPEDLGDNLSKTLSIQKAPQNLIIQLSRFGYNADGSFKKIDTKVDYPLEWTLKTEEGPVDYELYAVSLHGGSLSGGHYWANVKAGDNWYVANDSSISPTTAQQVIGDSNKSNAYLLFYRKK